MKKTASIIILALVCACLAFAGKPQKTVKKVIYKTDIDCEHCAEKIMNNIAFEKGVCDLSVNVEEQTVEVKYYEVKNDTTALRKAINKLGYKAKVVEFE